MEQHTVTIPELTLESGRVLREVPVAYRTWGRLNRARNNVIVACHALTGNADLSDWWGPLLGPGRLFDTERYFVVCLNVLGSPYGTASPLTPDPATGRPYAGDFPEVTVRDTVALHKRVLDGLGITGVAMATGGSMGAMHVLEWAFYDDYVRTIVPMAVGAWHSAWCIGWSEAQRQAIYRDPLWQEGHYDPARPPGAGLATARMMAMVSYRSRPSFEQRFGRERMPGGGANGETGGSFAIESYLRYQGDKLVERFDPACYVRLTQQMDTHDVARGRGASAGEVLGRLEQPALVIGIDSDVLYPLEEQRHLAEHLPKGELAVLRSIHGHDAFLIEFEQLEALIRPWMELHLACYDHAEAGACP